MNCTTVEFDGHILTEDEIEACRLLLKDIRAKKELDRKIKASKIAISFEISHAISEIGLEETKRIVREFSRELRECSEEDQPF